MHFKIQLIIDDDQGEIKTEDVLNFERVEQQASLVELSLTESKELLKALQKQIVLCQAEEFSNSHRHCSCSQKTPYEISKGGLVAPHFFMLSKPAGFEKPAPNMNKRLPFCSIS